MRNLVKKILFKLGYTVSRVGVGTDFVAWVRDEEFEQAFAKVSSYTLLDRARLFMLWQFARQAAKFGGATAQVGVFRGGSARLIAYAQGRLNSPFFLFDTFSGMPAVNERVDIHKMGDFADTSLKHVQSLFAGIQRAQFFPGVFPQTASLAEAEKFSFVYIDVDIYQSTLDSIRFFYPRMIKGGFIIFDDYMGKHTPGVKLALDEFLHGKEEQPLVTTIGQCIIIKQ